MPDAPMFHRSNRSNFPVGPRISEKVSGLLQAKLAKAGINDFPVMVLLTVTAGLTAENLRELALLGLRVDKGEGLCCKGTLFMSGMNLLGRITALPHVVRLKLLDEP